MDVTVTTPGGTSATSSADQFTYMAVTGISPAAGPLAGGTSVTITGTGFTGATAVDFGTARGDAAYSRLGDADHGHEPGGTAGTVDVTVTGPGGTSTTSSADQFTYIGGADGDGHQSHGGAVWRRHDGDDHGHGLHRARRRSTSARPRRPA